MPLWRGTKDNLPCGATCDRCIRQGNFRRSAVAARAVLRQASLPGRAVPVRKRGYEREATKERERKRRKDLGTGGKGKESIFDER